MPPAIPEAPAFSNTVVKAGNVTVETHNSLEMSANVETEVKTNRAGEPHRIRRGSYKGEYTLELGETDADAILSAAGGLGGGAQVSKTSSPPRGEGATDSGDFVLTGISASYQKDEENMKTLTMMATSILSVKGTPVLQAAGGGGGGNPIGNRGGPGERFGPTGGF